MHIQFAELPVSNQERAINFYTELFDCRVAADQPMGKNGRHWIELTFPDAETALHFITRKDGAPSETPVLVLVTDNVDATVKRLRSGGVKIVSEPHEPPWQPGRLVAEFQDSEGNRIMIGSKRWG